MSTTQPVIGFLGLTHLGLNSAAASAERGHQTICLDTDAALIERLRAGELHFSEPDLPMLISRNSGRLKFTADASALADCDVVYIAPDVATDDEGQGDLSVVDVLLDMAFSHTRTETTIVVLSQVPPGYTREHLAAGHMLYYQVETLIFGRAVERALNPERFIIGAEDPDVRLPVAYQTYLKSYGCPRLVMRYESAELAKISINCCLAASISTANMLAELCETMGADWSEIVPALKLDQRIGPHAYLSPGLGISGGNLERDLAAVRRMAKEQKTDAGVVSAWISNSAYRKNWVYRTLKEYMLDEHPNARIAVLGLAYKENTNSTKNAPALLLLDQLSNAAVTVYDPIVLAEDLPDRSLTFAPDAETAIVDADAVVIMTPWDDFRQLDTKMLADRMAGRLVLDPFRVLDRRGALDAGLEYVTLGVSERGP